jgi:hypothetical protein
MIAKGTPHDNGSRLAVYLTRGKDGETAELFQLRGFGTNTNIKDAFRDVHVIAAATKAEQPFFHVQVRLPEGEKLPRAQWEQTADRIGRMLGLKDQPRAIAFHIDKHTGEEHMHVAWSRIDAENMKAIPLPFFKERLKKLSRELELQFGLTQVTSHRNSEIKYAPTKAEEQQARRLGTDIHEIRETIRDCYKTSDCGRSFQSALVEHGLTLAKGDRRDYLVIDEAGGMHALGKKLLDATAAQVRNRLGDLDRTQLPTLEQAREQRLDRELAQIKEAQRETRDKLKTIQAEIDQPTAGHNWDRDRADAAWQEAVIDAAIQNGNTGRGQHQATPEELTGPRAHITEARQQSDNPQAFIAALAEHGIGLAQASRADAVQSELESTEAQITGGWKPTFREGEIVAVSARGDVYRLTPRTTGDQDIQKLLAGFKVQAEFRRAAGDPLLLSIEEMQRQRQQHQQELQAFKAHAEPKLGKTAGNIRLAYNLTDSPLAFKEFLEQGGLTAARVGWQDVRQRENARKQENQDATIGDWNAAKPELIDVEHKPAPAPDHAKTPSRRLSDHAREGDVVILDRWGNIYEPNQRTTGDTRKDAQGFLAGIGYLPSIETARRELDEKRRQAIQVPTGPQHGGLVAQQMWALRRLLDADRQRREPQRREDQRRKEEERRAEEAARRTGAEVDPHRYLTDPDYRRQVKADRAYKTPEERKAARENELRALLEQQDRQR